jgi:hypothetical protein
MSDEQKQEPTAWGVFYGDWKLHSSWDSHANAECAAATMRKLSLDHLGVYVSPLYRSPTLTDAELEAIEAARDILREMGDDNGEPFAAEVDAISGLLERLG